MSDWLAWVFIVIELVLIVFLVRMIIGMAFFAFGLKQTLPFVPTSRRVVREMVRSGALEGKKKIIDLGSGAGDLLGALRRHYPDATFVGVEKNRGLVALSRLRYWFHRRQISFVQGDMFDFPVNDADAIVGFWISDFTPKLVKKFATECQPGCVIVSHMFRLPENDQIYLVEERKTSGSKVLVYRKRGNDTTAT